MANEVKKQESYNDVAITDGQLNVEIFKKYVNVPNNHSDKDIALDVMRANQMKLNPMLGDMYYAQGGKLVPTKQGEQKLASMSPNFVPPISGIVVIGTDGELKERVGTAKLPKEVLVGGWAKVESMGYETTVSFAEYYSGCYVLDENGEKVKDASTGKPKKKKKSDGNYMNPTTWDNKPATMIKKVAYVQALREAFPQTYAGVYFEEEQGFNETNQEPKQVQPVAQPVAQPAQQQATVVEEF